MIRQRKKRENKVTLTHHKKVWSTVHHQFGDFDLDSRPDVDDVVVEVREDAAVVGYLRHDGDCDNPLLGEGCTIYFGDDTKDRQFGMRYALGLDEYWAPDIGYWLQQDVSEEDAMKLWRAGRADGTIGNRHAILVCKYGNSAGPFTFRCVPDIDDDNLSNFSWLGVWVPDPDLWNTLDAMPELEARNRALELAMQTAAEYQDWVNGDVYYTAWEEFVKVGKNWRSVGDPTFGPTVIGEKEALAVLREEVTDAIAVVARA